MREVTMKTPFNQIVKRQLKSNRFFKKMSANTVLAMPNSITLSLSLVGIVLLELLYAGCIWSMLKHRKRLLVNARSPILAAVQGLTIMPFSGAILVQVSFLASECRSESNRRLCTNKTKGFCLLTLTSVTEVARLS